MSRRKVITYLLVILIAAGALAGIFNIFTPAREKAHYLDRGTGSGNAIGVVRLEGSIMGGSGQGGLLGAPGTDEVARQLRKAGQDQDVDVVIIRINSPGGSAAASQEVHREVERLKEQGKKIVVSMSDMAASGGYWVASAADVIVANPATYTGSIGVIMQVANLEELYEKLGVDIETIKSGEFKDIGSASRTLLEQEREILQELTDDVYEQFIDVVAKGREMKREDVISLADGKIYTGRQAKELGLVDELGSFYDAVEIAKDLVGLEGEVPLKEYGSVNAFNLLWGGTSFNLADFLGPITLLLK